MRVGTGTSLSFDFGYWNKQLSATIGKEKEIVRLLLCDSPVSIVAIERFRRIASTFDLGPSVPVDRFVFGIGEAPARHVTKVNGLPYRPAQCPWPHDCEGEPMTFLAQFCFADSADYMGDLPGDVLLVFVRTIIAPLFKTVVPIPDPYYGDDAIVCEWYKLGLSGLAERHNVPEPRFEFPVCFGVRHRSIDFLDNNRVAQAMRSILDKERLPSHEFFEQAALQALARHPRMKVGGAPFWYLDREEDPEQPADGRFLGSFWGVNPVFESQFPWTNRRRRLSLSESSETRNHLIFADGGCINFFLKDNGTVTWHSQLLH